MDHDVSHTKGVGFHPKGKSRDIREDNRKEIIRFEFQKIIFFYIDNGLNYSIHKWLD